MTPYEFRLSLAIWLKLVGLLCLGGCAGPLVTPSAVLIDVAPGSRIIAMPKSGTKLVVRSTQHGVLHLDAGTVEIEALPAEPLPLPPDPAPPKPGPKPNPPGPGPSLPDGKYGLAKWTKTEVERLLSDRPTRAAEAKLVAEAVTGISAKLVAGAYEEGEGVRAFNDLLASVKAALGPAMTPWWPIQAAVRNQLTALADAGKLTGMSEMGEALREVSEGLEAVK